MPSKKIVSSKKDQKKEKLAKKKKPRPISNVGGGLQGGMLSGYGTGTDR